MFRVKLAESGHEVTVGAIRDGMTVLDKPATDAAGNPLPPKFKLTVDEAAERQKTYSSMRKAELEAEVEARNATRADDEQIAVEGSGTVSDLVAALEADDEAAVVSSTTTGGESATSEEDSSV